MSADPLISVVAPVKNERAHVRKCVEGILSQTLANSLEIIFVDSGSTDDTLEILAEYPVKVHQIPASQFNHGDTRNLGVRLGRGQFVALTVADARPVDNRWLECMLKHFDDPKVAGVCGQQVVPHEPDKNPLQWFRPYSEPVPKKVWFANPDEFEKLSPSEKLALCGWDDVTALYRRSVLLELPFRRVGFAEDMIWAKDALLRGHALVYDYGARVYHYHHENVRFRFRRRYTILFHQYRHFGLVPTPTWLLPELAHCGYRVARRKYCPSHRFRWLAYNVRLTTAEWLAGWIFWLQARLGLDGAVNKMHARLCATPPKPAPGS